MPTEALKKRIRDEVARRMGAETNDAFAKRAGVDPQTLGDFLAGRRWPRRTTLNKIESALGLTRGTLVELGEESTQQPMTSATDLAALSDADLVAELSYRLEDARRRVAELEAERGEVSPNVAEMDMGLAARHGHSQGKMIREHLDRLGDDPA